MLQIYGGKVYLRISDSSRYTGVTKESLRDYITSLGCSSYKNTFKFLVATKKACKKCAMVPFGRLTREELSIVEGSLYRYMIDNDS